MKYIILEKAQAKVGHVIMVNDGEEAEVTAVGEDGVTARDEKGKKFQVIHEHVEVKGKGGKKEEEEEPGKKEQKPGKGEPDLEVADDEEDKESEEEKAEKKPPKKKVAKKEEIEKARTHGARDIRKRRSRKFGIVKNHLWEGRTVKFYHPDKKQTVEGVVKRVERVPTFSQLVPSKTELHVEYEGKMHYPRKDSVRLVK